MKDGTVFLNLIKVNLVIFTWQYILFVQHIFFDQRLQYLFIWRDNLWNNDCARRVTHGFRVTKLWRTQIKFWHTALYSYSMLTDLEGKERAERKVCQWTAQESQIGDDCVAGLAEPENYRRFGWGSTWPSWLSNTPIFPLSISAGLRLDNDCEKQNPGSLYYQQVKILEYADQ
jgi:hypothetical protein